MANQAIVPAYWSTTSSATTNPDGHNIEAVCNGYSKNGLKAALRIKSGAPGRGLR